LGHLRCTRRKTLGGLQPPGQRVDVEALVGAYFDEIRHGGRGYRISPAVFTLS
jgi:hypothetical protein